jgi:hypothetical protein
MTIEVHVSIHTTLQVHAVPPMRQNMPTRRVDTCSTMYLGAALLLCSINLRVSTCCLRHVALVISQQRTLDKHLTEWHIAQIFTGTFLLFASNLHGHNHKMDERAMQVSFQQCGQYWCKQKHSAAVPMSKCNC